MIDEVRNKQLDISRLCQRYHVRRLDLFGSASVGNFDSQSSDLDFLVVFDSLPPREHADAYFGLLAELCDLFKRDVDLVELQAVNNPYFLEAAELSRLPLYAA